ncbi:type 2 isopentenyl-diphosphate Delta-isomerase [Corynebacterium terpenotabidum]|uniref:Isopentenyl-diphosphate delta-isomerase n=1 Tax=Corynebacterium terpenotabidum Y-11 TaxID=1200352 RepID=S4XFG0_9CORY|nr:type 2 isopentenyl-diphosphate Delta-isomerase [Corynebacterium terpenotabidum]AGP30360.1 isopentenyl pyrophosphate isomerase [Corynebacterium terpenotabidum Y-11]
MAISRDAGGGSRKDEHVRLAEELRELRDGAAAGTGGGTAGAVRGVWDDIRVVHHSFPGVAFNDVSLSTTVCGRNWEVPFFINAMTGGSEKTALINADLARAAAATGVAMATGSASPALKDPSLAHSFRVVRENAPSAFLFANVSPEMTVAQARDAVGFLDADALQVHVNPAQELVMPEGDRDFTGWLDRVAEIVAGVDVPVVVKEVGFGLSARSVAEAAACGVAAVDVSGRGGTNFIDIENRRREKQEYAYLSGWGQTAAECLLDLQATGAPGAAGAAGAVGPSGAPVQVLASGGVATPLDVVRALALGASAVGVSGHFLHVLMADGLEALIDEITAWTAQVRTLMTLLGAASVPELRQADVLVTGETADFARLRGVDLAGLARR